MPISDNIFKPAVYIMPPEWHTHAATLLHWPSNRETWPGERLERVESVYTNIIRELAPFEPVLLFAESSKIAERAKVKLADSGVDLKKLRILTVPLNDVWARDCGPIFVMNRANGQEFAITNWGYNAWGEKYPPFDDDNRIPEKIAEKFDIPVCEPGMILEGGSIEVNGNGVLLTTESVLLNQNRNPGLNRQQIAEKLKHYLGVEKIIWLKKGLAGDDTDGHIDDLSRFVNPSAIVTSMPENEDDINYPALKENLEILKNAVDQNGNPFEVITIPLPETRIEGTTVDGSEYVPASYANFYIANGILLLPFYDERYDHEMLRLFKSLFPGSKVVGIPCRDLVWGQGSIHCITQQLYGIDIFK